MPKQPKFVQISAQGAMLWALDEVGTVWTYGVLDKVSGWAPLTDHRFQSTEGN